jgi:hypothetical protein
MTAIFRMFLLGKTMQATYSSNTKTTFHFEADTDSWNICYLVYEEHVYKVRATTSKTLTTQKLLWLLEHRNN